MRFQLWLSAALLTFAWGSALADDRALNADERTKLAAAAAAEGCSGGEMEFDNRRYEVDEAQCGEGRRYDLGFDASFKLVSKSALADDDALNADKRTKLTAAVATEGCSGGEMEFDNGRYEVDEVQCGDGRRYDLDFDRAFKLISKEVND
jgi:hypothetical protein